MHSHIMRIPVLRIIIAILCLITLVVGCGKSGDSNIEDPTNLREQWESPYAFDELVVPTDGSSGILNDYTIELTFETADSSLKLRSESENHGKVETDVQVKCTDGEIVTYPTFTIECYKIHHHITVLQNQNWERVVPTWANIDIWIPAEQDLQLSGFYGVCAKATLEDSSGITGLWSWLTNPSDQPSDQKIYEPYVEGDFGNFDDYIINTIYGMPWQAFSTYSTGGVNYFELVNYTVGEGSQILNEERCEHVTRLIGNCEFTTWDFQYLTSQEASNTLETGAAFTSDMPLPFFYYVKIKKSGTILSSITWSITSLNLKEV